MNGKINWNIVAFGRVAGLLVITIAIAITIWELVDLPAGTQIDSQDQVRYFFQGVMRWAPMGILIIVAAEIADRLGWGHAAEEPLVEEPPLAPPPPVAPATSTTSEPL